MGRAITILVAALLIVSCASTPQSKPVVSNSVSFKNYNFLVIQKSIFPLLDIGTEFGDLMQIYSMKIITLQEYENLTPTHQKQTLYTRIYLSSKGETDRLNISFEDAITGEEKSNFSGVAQGDMSNSRDRSKALQSVSNKIIKVLKRDKGLIADKNKLLADEREAILPGTRLNTTNTLVKEYRVVVHTLNVRKAPMVGFDIIEKVKEGDILKKISSLLGWIKVELPSGKKGWVSMKYLQPIAESNL